MSASGVVARSSGKIPSRPPRNSVPPQIIPEGIHLNVEKVHI